MHINVRLLGRLRDVSGKTVLSKDIDENSTLSELIDEIVKDGGIEFKKLLLDPSTNSPLSNVGILVNGRHTRFVGLETRLKEGVVDLLTAVSGGLTLQPFLISTSSALRRTIATAFFSQVENRIGSAKTDSWERHGRPKYWLPRFLLH